MVRKLTFKEWIHTGPLVLGLLAFGGAILWKVGPSAIEAMRGLPPARANKESIGTIYMGSAVGVMFIIFPLILFIGTLKRSVRGRVNRYLAEHGGVTMSMLDSDFFAAKQVDNVWVGRRWSFCNVFRNIPLENNKIVWVHTDISCTKYGTDYWICLGLVDGTVEKEKVSHKKLPEITALYKKYPHILVSDNPKYGYMFKNDREAFLSIKYRQAQDEYR